MSNTNTAGSSNTNNAKKLVPPIEVQIDKKAFLDGYDYYMLADKLGIPGDIKPDSIIITVSETDFE